MKIIHNEKKNINSTEMAIIDFINNEPREFCSHPIQIVSKMANVSSSTMTRVCQKLGFSSFKNAQMFVYEKSKLESDYYNLGDDNTPEQIIHNVRGSSMYNLNETLAILQPDEMMDIAKKIKNSRRVIVMGLEQQTMSANAFVLNLAKINIIANSAHDVHTYSQMAISADENDFAIFITRTGWTKEVIESIKWSYEKNIPCLILTIDKETTKSLLDYSFDKKNSYMIETQVINKDRIKYPAISSLPGELIIFDVLFNMIISLDEKLREILQKTQEISFNWNFEGHL